MMPPSEPVIEEGLISVIMSCYNTSPAFLKKAIESVLCQTYENFEFIIVDDGSANHVAEIIQSYRDPRMTLLRNEENIGLPRSLNKALAVCRGEYVARMDADDICYPRRFEQQIAYLREHPDIIVCGTWVEYIDENDNLTGYSARGRIDDMDTYRIYLLFGNRPTIFHPSVCFNRRLLLKYHIQYHEAYRYAEDYRMWVSCAKCAGCAIIPEILLQYRFHDSQITQLKREELTAFDYQVIQEQLDELHLTLTEEMKPLHFRLLTECGKKPYGIRIKKWCSQIIQANRQYRVYHQAKLEVILLRCRMKICLSQLLRPMKKAKGRLRQSVNKAKRLSPSGSFFKKGIFKKPQ